MKESFVPGFAFAWSWMPRSPSPFHLVSKAWLPVQESSKLAQCWMYHIGPELGGLLPQPPGVRGSQACTTVHDSIKSLLL